MPGGLWIKDKVGVISTSFRYSKQPRLLFLLIQASVEALRA